MQKLVFTLIPHAPGAEHVSRFVRPTRLKWYRANPNGRIKPGVITAMPVLIFALNSQSW